MCEYIERTEEEMFVLTFDLMEYVMAWICVSIFLLELLRLFVMEMMSGWSGVVCVRVFGCMCDY